MDIRTLKYFIGVAEERSIGRAADRLNLSKSALSRQIQMLEEDIGASLFVRTNSGVELTQAGEALLKTAHQVVGALEQVSEDIQRNSQQLTGRLNVGVYGTAMFNIIPEIQRAFCNAHPNVELVLYTRPQPQLLESLRQGHIQIVFDRYLPASADVVVELVVQESLVVALPHGNELTKLAAIRWSDFRDQPLIDDMGDPDSPLGYRAMCRPYGFTPQVAQRACDIMTSIALVAAGLGITVVPAYLQTMTFPNVVFRPLVADTEYTIDLHCAYRKGKQSLLLAAMLETVRKYRETRC